MSETLTFDVPTEVTPALSDSQTTAKAAASAVWQTATVSTLDEVERLLDRAEKDGHREHELTVLGPGMFVVRWR